MAVVAELVDLKKAYDLGEVVVHALRGVDLTFEEGDYVAIMGSSGSGKSTLLNILGCLDRPTSGRYVLGGEDVGSLDDDRLSEIRGQHIGFIFQSYNLIQQLTVVENIEVPLYYQGALTPQSRERCLELAEMVGLGSRLEHRPNQLSGGQQQRVAIARALASNPRLLLCDEPTGNLDSTTGRAVLRLLWDVNRKLNMTVIIITHSQPVARMGHRAASLRDGRIVSLTENAVPIPPEEIEW